MDPPVSDPDKINNQKEAGPSFHCPLYDTQLVHKISLTFLPGLATACVDNTTGDIFKTPGSVAADVKQEMIEYLNHRSETFVADHILLSSSSEIEPSSHDPYDVVSDFVDDFATSKRNLFSRVSGWLLSERREDNIDDFAQEMEVSGFWLNDHIEGIAQTLLKNVDFKGLSHCEMKFQTQGELEEHVLTCGYRTMDCGNEGCNAVFCANQRESHDAVCPFKIIPCEQGCLESGGIMRREMDRHCITVCTMKLVNCAFRGVGCLDDVRQCEVQQHYLDSVGSHLMCVLKGMYKEASLDDLKPRAEEILQLSTRLSEARNARALTNLVKEIDAKLGALVIKPKKEKKALEEAEIKGKPETASEKIPEDKVVSKEAEVVVDDAMVEEVGKKVSEAEIAENVDKEGELKAQKLLEMDEFIKEGEDSSAADLAERTETKAPEVVVMDEDKEEEESPKTKQTRTNETKGLETEASDVIDEENRETKISAETKKEAPSTILLDKEENEEGAEAKQISTNESKGVETKVNDMIDEENNKETKIPAETKSEAPSRIVIMDKEENEEGAETKQTSTNETKGVETEVNDVIDEENKKETNISDETKREAPSSIVMDKEENEEGAETINSSASASDEAEALSKSSEGFSKAQAETEPNFS
ncbi:myosin-2 isoform X2 [Brassica rapa]|uniref:myosin-2 isoform X2 n=1 Tax=Brassica campestris TaxID=3711 RepID=UPI00142E2160|nr:myosin-2 isoform X2 [Brassica rapa]